MMEDLYGLPQTMQELSKPALNRSSSGWQSFAPTWTYKEPWYRRLMFWRKMPQVTGIYKQVGKVVHVRFLANQKGDTKVVLPAPIKAKGDTITVTGTYEVEVTE